ncbi:acyl-ACP thioesterase [Pseudomonas marginalis]|nr:acyl-ACP thioesterase [Pseudomonas marginalis]MCP1523561.1 acyl-ACP thioesterase [Pseudomonas marginalis]MDQ0502519.1 acyl-ACP thioesterase [Pseudomonas marginalis]
MNLWFRLLYMLCRRPWRKPAHGLATTVVRMRVWPLDLDLNRHVTNGRYFSILLKKSVFQNCSNIDG